jgi:puromycin-sensitive aminopeptidase
MSRSSSQDAAWAFDKENGDMRTKTLGVFQGIPRIAGAVGAFCTPEKRAEVEQFFKQHPVPAAERALRQAFERIDNCVALKGRQAPAASAWLASAAR